MLSRLLTPGDVIVLLIRCLYDRPRYAFSPSVRSSVRLPSEVKIYTLATFADSGGWFTPILGFLRFLLSS